MRRGNEVSSQNISLEALSRPSRFDVGDGVSWFTGLPILISVLALTQLEIVQSEIMGDQLRFVSRQTRSAHKAMSASA